MFYKAFKTPRYKRNQIYRNKFLSLDSRKKYLCKIIIISTCSNKETLHHLKTLYNWELYLMTKGMRKPSRYKNDKNMVQEKTNLTTSHWLDKTFDQPQQFGTQSRMCKLPGPEIKKRKKLVTFF